MDGSRTASRSFLSLSLSRLLSRRGERTTRVAGTLCVSFTISRACAVWGGRAGWRVRLGEKGERERERAETGRIAAA